MGEMLTQAEIDALLNSSPGEEQISPGISEIFSPQDFESLQTLVKRGTQSAANAMTSIIGQNVSIIIEDIQTTTWANLYEKYNSNHIIIGIAFSGSVTGKNIIAIKSDVAKQIAHSMTGVEDADTGDGLTEFDLGVLGEIMNQAAGSFVTAITSLTKANIAISTPDVSESNFNVTSLSEIDDSDGLVNVTCEFVVDGLCTDNILFIYPVSLTREMIKLIQPKENGLKDGNTISQSEQPEGYSANDSRQQYNSGNGSVSEQVTYKSNAQSINVQPAKFQSFDNLEELAVDKKNLSLIMDVPLQITVELGRTKKAIKNILEYGPGSVIELDKLAGDPVDILVNGKYIAKGEVVVIDESFGVRITDIVDTSKRL